MILFPNAKINIGLNIVEKRADGFHNIETVFCPIGLSDVLEIVQSEEFGVQSSGIEIPDNAENNLCVKAYHLIKKDYDLPPVKIHLHKIIPIGAGLGGGSSDAAFFIKAIDELFELNLAWGEKHHYARQLGSDCSFFITNRPAFADGRGDNLETIKLSLRGYFILLIKPQIHISTAEAYSGVKPKKPGQSLEKLISELPITQWKQHIHNDFENSVFKNYPEIKTIKKNLYECGAIYASMSGSGSSVYGIFRLFPTLSKKTKTIFENYFTWEGQFTA